MVDINHPQQDPMSQEYCFGLITNIFLTARHCLQKFRDELGNEIPLNNFYNHSPYWINVSDSFNNYGQVVDFYMLEKYGLLVKYLSYKYFRLVKELI